MSNLNNPDHYPSDEVVSTYLQEGIVGISGPNMTNEIALAIKDEIVAFVEKDQNEVNTAIANMS